MRRFHFILMVTTMCLCLPVAADKPVSPLINLLQPFVGDSLDKETARTLRLLKD